MEIRDTYTRKDGKEFSFIYHENDPHKGVETHQLRAVHGFCFTLEGQMILVNHPTSGWIPPGGGVEKDEHINDAVIREVLEETNMKVLHKEYLGSVDYPDDGQRHVRFFCLVKPLGPFVSDPDGDIEEIKEVDPFLDDIKNHFDWGPAGDRLMKLSRDMFSEFKKQNKNNIWK
jgi:8-oxo-dGTP diphosphatase